jgi:hypothetical protein
MNNITTKNLSLIIIIGFTLGKLFVLPALLAGYVNESLWISTLINMLVDLLLLFIVCYFLKNTDKTFPELLKISFGDKGGKIISFLYFLFFICKAFIPILEQKNTIEFTFYETQPTLFTFMPFFIVAFYITIKGLKPFAKSIEFCIWIFGFGLVVTILLSLFAGDYTNLLPIFSKSPRQLLGASFKSILWYGDPVFLLYFLGYAKRDNAVTKKLSLSFALYSFITILVFVIFYSIFSSIAERQYYAILKMSKYSITLSNIGRYDYIASLLLSAISVYLTALPLMLASISLNDCFSFKNKFISPIIVFAISVTLTLLTQNFFFPSIEFTQNYLAYFFIIMTYILPLLLLLLLNRRKHLWFLKEQKS